MLQKKPKSKLLKFIIKGGTILFVGEALSFAASYGLWHRMNTDPEFRHYMNENWPIVLDGYYKFGELFGAGKSIRGVDSAVWQAKKPTQDQ